MRTTSTTLLLLQTGYAYVPCSSLESVIELNKEAYYLALRIASIDNPAAVFDSDAAPHVSSPLQTLDLGGHGIRGMSYVAPLQGYLVISGPASRADHAFGLWFWSGEADAPARRVTVPGLAGFERAEGVCPAVFDGVSKILIVSDDGDRKKGRFARFVLLELAQLQIAT